MVVGRCLLLLFVGVALVIDSVVVCGWLLLCCCLLWVLFGLCGVVCCCLGCCRWLLFVCSCRLLASFCVKPLLLFFIVAFVV